MTWTIPPRFDARAGIAGVDCGHGEPLLLLHGVGLRAEAWAAQIARFSASHRVIALDTPGHGHSVALSGRPGVRDFVAAIAGFLEDIACGPVNVAGHSLGALLAIGLTLEHPHLVLRMAALNGVHRRNQAARAAVIERAEAMLAGNVDHAAPLRRWFGEQASGDERVVRDHVAGWLAMAEPSGYAAAYHAFAHAEDTYAARLDEITCPALFLTGELDPNSTPAMTRAMAAATPHGHAVVLHGQRHMANMVAPGAVGDAMQAWLAEAVHTPRSIAS